MTRCSCCSLTRRAEQAKEQMSDGRTHRHFSVLEKEAGSGFSETPKIPWYLLYVSFFNHTIFNTKVFL
jgi:hypothetical protein